MSSRFTRVVTGTVGIGSCLALTSYLFVRRRDGVPLVQQHGVLPSSGGSSSTNPSSGSNSTVNVSSSAQALKQDVVDAILRDPRTIDGVVMLIKDVFTHPTTLDNLKRHFKWEFTDNDQTVSSLKKFIVNDVIQDPYVSDELIGVAKDLGTFLIAHPHIYPGATMDLLGAAALDALKTSRFHEDLIASLKQGALNACYVSKK